MPKSVLQSRRSALWKVFLAMLGAGTLVVLALLPGPAPAAGGDGAVASGMQASSATAATDPPPVRRHLFRAGTGPTATPTATPTPTSTPTPTPTPTVGPTPVPGSQLGAIETTNLIFTNLLPLVGGAAPGSLPSVETSVAAALAGGLDPIIAGLVAEDPGRRHTIPGGIQLDFGSGFNGMLGTVAGTIAATYSDFTSNGSSLSFTGSMQTTNFTINGAAYPLTGGTMQVAATRREDGTVTMSLTLNASGPGGATASGTVNVDTALCQNYPIGGSITTRVGAYTATIGFNNRCNGTFGFSTSGGQDFRFNPPYYDCYHYFGSWYDWGTIWLIGENGRLAVDNSDDDPSNMTLTGTVDANNVHLTFQSKCRTPGCDTQMSVQGTFNGHYWKSETSWGQILRYYVGTYSATFIYYNEDGSIYCQATRELNEQDGMDGSYKFYQLTR